MQIPEPPTQAWQKITADFITELLLFKDLITGIAYTTILVVVDWLTKYTILQPVPKGITAEGLAILMLRKVFI